MCPQETKNLTAMAMAERFATKEAYIMLHFALVFVEEYLGVFEDFFSWL